MLDIALMCLEHPNTTMDQSYHYFYPQKGWTQYAWELQTNYLGTCKFHNMYIIASKQSLYVLN